MMTTTWFDRAFDFNFGMEQYSALHERLRLAPDLCKQVVVSLPEDILQLKPDHKWSVKENIGHLLLLEPLWQRRFREIKEAAPGRGSTAMSPADLNNTATDAALFNNVPLSDLLEGFFTVRNETLCFLDSLEPIAFSYSCIHPRLQKPMRIIDLMFFVAEHDDHHLNTIQTIIKTHTL